ncbi:MAG: PKD domain-containing protein [Chitinophagaceae bacterium]
MQVSNETVTGACPGIGITFTNTSTVSADKLKWDFGDNYTATNISSIAHSYTTSGTYTVTLTNTETQASASQTITIWSNPTAKFTISDSVACTGINITFQSNSTPGSSDIKLYSWTFGDGNVEPYNTSSSTAYAYTTAGTFIPILTVRDNNGCSGTSASDKTIKINGTPITSNFLANNSNFYSCTNTITFENTTNEAGVDNVAYQWDFGDNTTSTEKSPGAHTYSQKGVYTVSLTASYAGVSGCIPTFSKKVYIGTPTITMDAPTEICAGSTLDLSASADISGFISSASDVTWNLSGGTLNSDSTTATFGTTGTATLTATNKNGCPVTTTTKINILERPAITLSVSPSTGICIETNVLATVDLTNSVEATSYLWAPEGINGSTQTTTSTNSYTFQYPNAGTYNYAVTVTGDNGCTSTETTSLNVLDECIDNGYGSAYNPIFSFKSVSCSDKYTIVITNKESDKTVAYWQIGDNTYPAEGGSATISLSPAVKGTVYLVSTYYTDGTSDLNRQITIIDETAAFTIVNNANEDNTLYCTNNAFTFATKDIDLNNIASYSWTILDAQNNVVKTSTSRQFNYTFTATGTYTVQLMITDITTNACTSTATQQITVYGGMSASFSSDVQTFCTSTANVNFTGTVSTGLSPLVSQVWNFGDNSDTTINESNTQTILSHTYTYTGSSNYKAYTVWLKETDEMGCTITISKTSYIKIYQPTIGFTSTDTLLCSTRDITITNLSSARNATYTWTVGNQTSTSNNFSYTFSDVTIPSDLDVSLSLVDEGGCTKDTSVDSYIRFRKPIAQYTISNEDALYTCPPYTLTIKNTSENYDSVYWTINTFNSIQKDSFYYSVLHPGTVSIHLKAMLDGCTDSAQQDYTVKGPVASLLAQGSTTGCTPLTVLLYVSDTSDIVSYQWDQGDGEHYYTDTVSYSKEFTYTKGGTYYPSVTFVGKEGCSDKQELDPPVVALQSVNLQYPGDTTFCLNETSLRLTVSADSALKYTWSQTPTTGYMSSTDEPSIEVKPTENTTYHVVATSPSSCPDESADIFVETLAASEVSFTPNLVTEPAGTAFTFTPNITNPNLGVRYYWEPDYHIDNRYLKNPTIIADVDTTYRLVVKNENGCTSADTVHVHVLCNSSKLYMANAFTPNGDGKNDRFYVTGYGIKSVVHFIVIDRWGKKVFERNNVSANDMAQGWDGNINGHQAAPGTYIYMADVECTEGNRIPLKGTVVLIR